MKEVRIKKKGKKKEIQYEGDKEEQPLDIAHIRELDQQYKHFDSFTKHSIRK